jgi:hypothetical protein
MNEKKSKIEKMYTNFIKLLILFNKNGHRWEIWFV